MGAEEFYHEATGKTAQEAFNNALEEAFYEHGHNGYTGTIAEKDSFRMVGFDATIEAHKLIDKCMEDPDHFCQDKCGPAGCVQINKETYAFFGWAAS